MSACDKRYYGKYRGTVINNTDPLQKGRLQVIVPDVSNVALSSWATPCLPFSGQQAGLFALPTVGSGAWVEFEQGDPDYPVWVGGFWGSAAELPSTALAASPAAPNLVLQTIGQNSVTIFGSPGGGITLCCGPATNPASPRIVINQSGIVITNGAASINLSGTTVDINKGALTVT